MRPLFSNPIWIVSFALTACAAAPAASPPPAHGQALAPSSSVDAPGGSQASNHAATSEQASATGKMPTECEEKGGEVCTPPVAFAGRLCGGTYPDVALSMFAKGTPWTRAYVVREVEAWNASGGRTSSAKMLFEEEVLVLKQRRQKASAVQVGAGGSYDVLRWDGSCVSLMSDEVTLKRPPTVKHAPIPWRRLDLGMRDTLLTDKKIERVYSERLKECKNGSEDNGKCAKAEARLTSMIVEHVSSGGPLAEPEDLP